MAKTPFANEEIDIENSAPKEDEYPDHVLVSNIRGKLKRLGPPLSRECCIYKVPKKLRKVNEAAYTPHVVSIGPLHHRKKTLKKMQKHKLRYLDKFLTHVAQTASLENLVSVIKEMESSIRCCYAETLDYLSSDKFVEMILLDASFIFELFLGKYFVSIEMVNDIFLEHLHEFSYNPGLLFQIEQDLILLENQLPFFVLKGLYDLAFGSRSYSCYPSFPSFLDLSCSFFCQYNKQQKSIIQEVRHFTDLLRSFRLPLGGKPEIHDEIKANDKSIQQKVKRFADLLLHCRIIYAKPEHIRIGHLYSATELHDAGVKFKKSDSNNLFDIEFSNGVLTIPYLELYDETESHIRNLMVLEQCHYPHETYICHYVSVMDHLINTAQDVDLLVQEKVIVNMLGDRVQVATLFNNLCKHIVLSNASGYNQICRDLNAYYNVPRHKWKAILYKQYFSTPWRIASIIAAFILLVLTLTQTICTIISL